MLCYVDDSLPGINRRKLTRGWGYYDAKGKRITDRDEIDRLNAVGMPPAYADCWFCPSPHGHLQAVGYDDRGRKQYRYHADFRDQQEAAKYDRCGEFGHALSLLRARVETDLANRGVHRDNIVAAVVRLLDLGKVRVGNEAYTRDNGSFGATTLTTKHAEVGTAKVKLEYRGKSGKMQRLTIADRSLARMVRRCQDLPGQKLFQYVGDNGAPHAVTSSDVNDYIREAMGGEFTAKHFRTWGASVIAFQALYEAGEDGLTLKAMLEPVAAALGNTPAISRKSYVHPLLIAMAKGGAKFAPKDMKLPAMPDRLPRVTRYLSAHERGLIALLDGSDASGHQGRKAA